MSKRHARLYAFVHPVFWPWLWLQLWQLKCWQRAAKRDVLFAVDCWGNLYITAISDAPRDPSLYTYAAPAVPAWADPGLASGLPQNIARAATDPAPSRHTLAPTLPPATPPTAPDTS